MTVASKRMAKAIPMPIILIADTPLVINAAKLTANTSAAAVAIALDEANRTGRMSRGDTVLLIVFGGGLTWAGSIIEW